ncbi:TetR/AcrR family transcriptional regulator [Actinophytocola sediminis]
MSRLSRAELRELNRAKVLAAARDEFADRGFRAAKIDDIAERAELTRGAVYSNFPGKRALYFAVLAAGTTQRPPGHGAPGETPSAALGALAREWVARLPLATDERHGRLTRDLLPEILAEETTRRPFAQLMSLNATLLGLSLEHLGRGRGRRMVRVAEAALTTLHGAAQLAAAAPGFLEPFNVVRACEQLADLDLDDRWLDPGLHAGARPVDEPWNPPAATDLVADEPVDLSADGVLAVLGLDRASAAEDVVRAVAPDTDVTVVLVTGDPAELAPLARLAVADLMVCLRQAVPQSSWPHLKVVCDEPGAIAEAAGAEAVLDSTEIAIRVAGGRVVTRASGMGAGHTMSPRSASRSAPVGRVEQ